MEQDLEVESDREPESGVERFVGGDTLKGVFPKGAKRVLDSRFRGNDEIYTLTFLMSLKCIL